MHEQYRSPAHDRRANELAYPAGQTEAFDSRDPGIPSAETRRFPPAPSPGSAPRLSMPAPHDAASDRAAPGPLAHEGGLPYGNPPAPAYPPPHQLIPQHLAVPHQVGAGPYPQHQDRYMYPPQPFQQTVIVHNSRRVNHALHLVLTLLTAGLWLPVWIILAIANS